MQIINPYPKNRRVSRACSEASITLKACEIKVVWSLFFLKKQWNFFDYTLAYCVIIHNILFMKSPFML